MFAKVYDLAQGMEAADNNSKSLQVSERAYCNSFPIENN